MNERHATAHTAVLRIPVYLFLCPQPIESLCLALPDLLAAHPSGRRYYFVSIAFCVSDLRQLVNLSTAATSCATQQQRASAGRAGCGTMHSALVCWEVLWLPAVVACCGCPLWFQLWFPAAVACCGCLLRLPAVVACCGCLLCKLRRGGPPRRQAQAGPVGGRGCCAALGDALRVERVWYSGTVRRAEPVQSVACPCNLCWRTKEPAEWAQAWALEHSPLCTGSLPRAPGRLGRRCTCSWSRTAARGRQGSPLWSIMWQRFGGRQHSSSWAATKAAPSLLWPRHASRCNSCRRCNRPAGRGGSAVRWEPERQDGRLQHGNGCRQRQGAAAAFSAPCSTRSRGRHLPCNSSGCRNRGGGG